MPRRVARALLSCCLLAPGAAPAGAQSLPPYAPMNPLAFSRSGLETMPYADPAKGWRFTALADLANIIEYAERSDARLILDAEVLRLDLTLRKDLGGRAFVFGGTSVNNAGDGVLDGFLNWYHDLTGLEVGGRNRRPRNQYLYEVTRPGNDTTRFPNPGAWLGDLRLGGGLRHTRHWQTAVWITLPTGDGPAGFRRDAVTANAVTTVRSHFGGRFTYEGSLGAGWAGRSGLLEENARTTFLLLSSGLRARFIGPLHLYTNIVYHSPYYRDLGFKAYDNRELTIDVGGFFRFGGGPEWILGLTEDLEPRGPAVDLSFRVGARWY